MGVQRIRKFSAKMTTQAKKNTFFRIFLFSYTSTHRGATFFFIKISYLQPFREIMGEQGKALHRTNERTNDEQTTNERLHGRS